MPDATWPHPVNSIRLLEIGKSKTGNYRKLEIEKDSKNPSGPTCTNEKDPIELIDFNDMGDGTVLIQQMGGENNEDGFACTEESGFKNWLENKNTDLNTGKKLDSSDDLRFLKNTPKDEGITRDNWREEIQKRLDNITEQDVDQMQSNYQNEDISYMSQDEKELFKWISDDRYALRLKCELVEIYKDRRDINAGVRKEYFRGELSELENLIERKQSEITYDFNVRNTNEGQFAPVTIDFE